MAINKSLIFGNNKNFILFILFIFLLLIFSLSGSFTSEYVTFLILSLIALSSFNYFGHVVLGLTYILLLLIPSSKKSVDKLKSSKKEQ